MADTNKTSDLLLQAKGQMIENMKSRNIGAIIWSLPEAGFHYIPEIMLTGADGNPKTVRVTGLYHYDGALYAIEEDVAGISVDHFYREGVDVPPVVVTLSENKAEEQIGDPEGKAGFTTLGTLEEWVAIADCYFEALAES